VKYILVCQEHMLFYFIALHFLVCHYWTQQASCSTCWSFEDTLYHPCFTSVQVSWSDFFIWLQNFAVVLWYGIIIVQTEWFPCYPSSSGIIDRSFWILMQFFCLWIEWSKFWFVKSICFFILLHYIFLCVIIVHNRHHVGHVDPLKTPCIFCGISTISYGFGDKFDRKAKFQTFLFFIYVYMY
jgi:hypothetical protein